MFVRNVIGAPWELGLPLPLLGFDNEGEGGGGSGDSGSGGDGGTGGGGSDGDSGSGGDNGDTGGDDGGSGDGGSGDTVSKADYEALQRRMKAADARASTAEGKLKSIEDKDKDELTKATERAEASEKRVQDLSADNNRLRLQIAILTDKAYGADKWQDPSDVIAALAGSDQITVRDDGTVEGVSGALKDLAKSKAYWLKTTSGGASGGPSGDGGAGRGGTGGNKGAAKDAELRDKYPGLRRGRRATTTR